MAMTQSRPVGRLTTILLADVVGFSLLVGGAATWPARHQSEAPSPFGGSSQSFSLTLYVITPERPLSGVPTGPALPGTIHLKK